MSQLNVYAPKFENKAIQNPLPKVKTDSGRFVVSERPDTGGGCLIVLIPGSIFLMIILLGGLFNRENMESFLDFGPRFLVSETGYVTWAETIALLALILFTLFLIFAAVWERMAWHPHQLILPQRQLQRGTTDTLKYQRIAKSVGPSLGKEGVVCAQLVCQEVTKVRMGTDTQYKHNVLYTLPLEPAFVPSSAQGYSGTFEVTIPSDAPASYTGESSWVAWKLQIKTGLGNKWRDEVSFVLEVV